MWIYDEYHEYFFLGLLEKYEDIHMWNICGIYVEYDIANIWENKKWQPNHQPMISMRIYGGHMMNIMNIFFFWEYWKNE